jgi:hypothetical protein
LRPDGYGKTCAGDLGDFLREGGKEVKEGALLWVVTVVAYYPRRSTSRGNKRLQRSGQVGSGVDSHKLTFVAQHFVEEAR